MTKYPMTNDERVSKSEDRMSLQAREFRHWGFIILSSLGISSFVIPLVPAATHGDEPVPPVDHDVLLSAQQQELISDL